MFTQQSWLKTGLPPSAVNLLAKVNGHQTRRILTLLIITSGPRSGKLFEHYKAFHSKPKNTDGLQLILQLVLQLIWNQLPQDSINKAIMSFTKRVKTPSWDGRLERALG